MSNPPEFVAFGGAKLALLVRGHLLVILRDDIPTIPYPGHWDFPGGGREGDESPTACAFRELQEELGLSLPASQICHAQAFTDAAGLTTWFFVARADDLDLGTVVFGDEGATWQAMPVDDYLAHPRAIPHLARRFGDWWASNPSAHSPQ